MTDWSSVEFAGLPTKARKSLDFLPFLRDLLTLWDFLACVLAGWLALMLYARYAFDGPMNFSVSGQFWRDILFGSLISALVLRNPAALEDRKPGIQSRLVMAAEHRCLLAFTVLITVGLATRATDDLARLWLIGWFGIFASTVAVTRILLGRYVSLLHGNGGLHESVAILGSSCLRERLAARICNEANVVGTFCAPMDDSLGQNDSDDFATLMELGRDGGVDSVILAVDKKHPMNMMHIIECLKSLPIQVAICNDDDWLSASTSHTRLLGGLPMAVVADRPIKHWDLILKTLVDKVGALLLLIVLAPLMVAVAIAIGLTSPGPIIFRQRRQGWCGREFTVFKFRSMHADATGIQNLFQTLRQDARCTRVGRLLRRCSLDELPQLWNVLRGDMSLVGPRPHVDSLHDVDVAGREIIAEYAQRNRMKPGITGWAQVHGARGATATLDQLRHRVEFDLFYIENWSFWLDVKILLRTPFVMTGENAF